MAGTELSLPSLISNPSSIRRDGDGLLDERCLTPRSKILRDRVAAELRTAVLKQYVEDESTLNLDFDFDPADELGGVERDEVLHISLQPLLVRFEQEQELKKQKHHHHGHRPQAPATAHTEKEDRFITVFHTVMVLLLRDSICWNRLIACEAFCSSRIRNFAKELGTDMQSSFVECLKDKFHPVRRFAIEGFRLMLEGGEQLNKRSLATHLGNIARSDQDGRLRAEAAQVMRLVGKDGLHELVEITTGDHKSSFWPVRGEAALSIGSLGIWKDCSATAANQGRTALEELLKDRIIGVRECAAKALGAMGKEAIHAVQTLVRCTRDPDLRVRIAATRSLGQILGEATRGKPMKYGVLMVKADIESIAQQDSEIQLSDSLRLTCRALTCTLRDQEPLFKVALAAHDMENPRLEAFRSPESSFIVSELRLRERTEVSTQRKHIKLLFRAAEVALATIGPYCGPNMVARLIEEDADNAGFGNRMSLLRGLQCSGNGFASEDTTCVILSEWISAPQLNFDNMNMMAVANGMPVSGLKLETLLQDKDELIRYAVLRGKNGLVVLVFGVTDHAKAMAAIWDTTAVAKEVKVEDGSTQNVGVHSNMWDFVDAVWPDLSRSVLNHLEGVSRLVVTGYGMGGAIAKMVTLRLHTSDGDLLDIHLRSADTAEAEHRKKIVILRTFGSPQVLTGKRPRLLYCSTEHCRAWVLGGDSLPTLPGSEGTFRRGAVTKKGCCARRERQSEKFIGSSQGQVTNYDGLFDRNPLAASPLEKRSISGLNVSVKAYTNSMCWLQLEGMMKEA